MNYKQWEKRLLKGLRQLGRAERAEIAAYYRELYGDKAETGRTDEEILREFGSPEECAARILSEEREDATAYPTKRERLLPYSPLELVGLALLTAFIILPLISAVLAVLAAFVVGLVGGGIAALAGVVYCLAAPFQAISGVAATGIVAHFGIGVAALGAGLVLVVLFYYATKYLVLYTWKGLKRIYTRRIH